MVPGKTWDDAVLRWLEERSYKASLFSDRSIIRWLDKNLNGCLLSAINDDVVINLRSKKSKSGVKNSTVNRMLALLRGILNVAEKEWKWIEKAPRIKLLRESRRRIRYLDKFEALILLRELPEHLSDMAAFSLATGLRRSNVTGLEWSQVDMKRRSAWIHADQAKAGFAIPVPLNQDAMVILQKWVKRHSQYVFCYQGHRIQQTSTAAWYKALRRCRIQDFKWHDLRHTWATWHVQKGTPLHALQELGGWQTYEMVRRYAHFSASHLAVYANNMDILTLESSHNA